MRMGPRSPAKGAKNPKDDGISIATLVEPSKKAADVVVELTAQEGAFPLAGHEIEGFVLNGKTPGPKIAVKQGELVEVRLHNENVADGVALHWHGIDVPNAEDGVAGVTQNAVLPGKSHPYRFVAEQAGTYWYHSHQVSHEQVAGGLFGSLVVLPKAGVRVQHDLTAVAHTYKGNRTSTAAPGIYTPWPGLATRSGYASSTPTTGPCRPGHLSCTAWWPSTATT